MAFAMRIFGHYLVIVVEANGAVLAVHLQTLEPAEDAIFPILGLARRRRVDGRE